MIEEILSQVMQTKAMCALFTDEADTDKFQVVKINKFNRDCIFATSYNQYGQIDGSEYISLRKLIKIETNSEYLQALSILDEYRNKSAEKNEFTSLKEMLDYAKYHNKVCEIELCDSGLQDAVGFISEITKEGLTVQSVNEFGEQDGESILFLSDITALSFGSDDTEKIEILYREKEKRKNEPTCL